MWSLMVFLDGHMAIGVNHRFLLLYRFVQVCPSLCSLCLEIDVAWELPLSRDAMVLLLLQYTTCLVVNE